MTLTSAVLVLFFILDPIGNIASFQTVLKNCSAKKRPWIILREMLFALAMIALFYAIGETLLGFLQLSETTLQITCGLILFLVGINVLFPSPSSIRSGIKPENAPFLVPLAIPLTSGPSLLTTVMLYARLDSSNYLIPLAILISWTLATILQLFGAKLLQALGKSSLLGAERLCGMILVMLSIQRLAEGIQLFIKMHAAH